jgi:hypothetical protein
MELASYVNGASTTLTVKFPTLVVSLAKNAIITVSFPPQTDNYITSGLAVTSAVSSASISVTY